MDTIIEIRVHRNQKTLHFGWKAAIYNGPNVTPFDISLGRDSIHVEVHEDWISFELNGRVMTSWNRSGDQPAPAWTEIPCLFDGDRWIFEYRVPKD